jgi:hypothetical protein
VADVVAVGVIEEGADNCAVVDVAAVGQVDVCSVGVGDLGDGLGRVVVGHVLAVVVVLVEELCLDLFGKCREDFLVGEAEAEVLLCLSRD